MFKKRIEARMRDALREYVKDECLKIIVELFSETKDIELRYTKWYAYEAPTVVGALKKAVTQAVAADFEDKHKGYAMDYIRGEEFIDEVIQRINKKQISKVS